MSAKAVIDVARADLGYTESPPNSNKTKYGEWYGMNGQPWCVMALAYWFDQAGERMAFFGGGKTASCSMLLRWYKEQGLTAPESEVQVGDIVLLNFNGKGTPDHCGLVQDVDYDRNGKPTYVTTVEGNTTDTNGDQSNGGMVCGKYRSVRNVVAVCRPQYKKEEPMPKDDITGHWAEEAIRRCMKRKIINGYPDGSFAPDKPITRAEAVTMIDRLVQLLIGEDDGK